MSNRFLLTAGIVLLITLSLACSSKSGNQQPPAIIPLTNKDTVKNISIRFAGSVAFRRTFADIQFMTDEKEIDKYMKKQAKSNPELMSGENDSLRKKLERFGFVRGDELLLKEFKYSKKADNNYADNSGKTINIHFTFSTEDENVWIKVFSGNDSAKVKVDYDRTQYLKYSLLDIIPGGNKEIVLLNEYHIMNGDNFEMMVYEIKTRK